MLLEKHGPLGVIDSVSVDHDGSVRFWQRENRRWCAFGIELAEPALLLDSVVVPVVVGGVAEHVGEGT